MDLKLTLVNVSKMKEHILMNQHMGGDNELLEIKECITIKTLKPTLNDNATSTELFLFN